MHASPASIPASPLPFTLIDTFKNRLGVIARPVGVNRPLLVYSHSRYSLVPQPRFGNEEKLGILTIPNFSGRGGYTQPI